MAAILLDTHTLLWWMNGHPNLSRKARIAIGSSGTDVYVSAVSAIELAIKVRLGKLPEAARLTHRFAESLADQDFRPLPISIEHGRLGGLLPSPHRDPFDRLLAAQSIIEGMTLVSADSQFGDFGVTVLW
jgi:PIN domain nuclease of toxin-antitoxin system